MRNTNCFAVADGEVEMVTRAFWNTLVRAGFQHNEVMEGKTRQRFVYLTKVIGLD